MTVTKVKSKKQSKKNSKNGKKKTMKKNNFRKGRSMRGGGNDVWSGPNYNSGPQHFYPASSLTSAPPNKLLATVGTATTSYNPEAALAALLKNKKPGQSGQPTSIKPGYQEQSIKLPAAQPSIKVKPFKKGPYKGRRRKGW